MTKVPYEPENTPPSSGWSCISLPPPTWGKDHWSTLTYLETRAVDHQGKIDNRHMRTNPKTHPLYVHHDSGKEYPTRLRDGVTLSGHDDWSCMEDMIDAGMMFALMRGSVVWVSLTPFGSAVAGALRAFRSRGGVYANFTGWYFDMKAEGGTEDATSVDSE